MEQEPVRKKPGLLELLDEWEKQGASDAEITQRMNRYLDSKARKEGVPLHGTFELTPLCNLDCKMCYVHLSEKQLRETSKRLLTVDEWKNIMQQAIDAGMMTAILTGGECLTYPGFDELYLYLWNRGVRVIIKSNGILMTEERVQFLKQYPPAEVVITLYGSDEETYKRVTGRSVYSKVIAGIQNVRDAGFLLTICVTLNRLILKDVDKLLKLAKSFDDKFKINMSLYNARKETEKEGNDVDLTIDEYIQIEKLRAQIDGVELYPIDENDIPKPNQTAREAKGLPCAGGRTSFAVHWDGMLHPCLMLNNIKHELVNTSFLDAWMEIHDIASNYKFPGECIDCVYQPICPACIVLQGGEVEHNTLHANPDFCRRACKMVAEGLARIEQQI